MKKLLYLFIIVLFISCSSSEPKAVSDAEHLMNTKPDSALIALKKAKAESGNYSRKYRMKYYLLLAEAMNKNFIPMDTIQFMPEVLTYFQNHGTSNECVTANYMMGCVYRDKGDSPTSLKYYLDAVNSADTTKNDCDYKQLSRIYGQISLLYQKQRIPQRAIIQLQNCRKFALLAKDTLMAIQAYECMESAYSLFGNTDKAYEIAKKCYNDYKKIGAYNYAAAAQGQIIYYYVNHHEMKKAKNAINEYIMGSKRFNNNGDIKKDNEVFYYLIGKYYEELGNRDSAIYFYNKLTNSNADIDNIGNGYRGLLSVYSSIGNIDSVLKYANKYADANDSASLVHSADEINRTKALYDYNENLEISNKKTKEANKLRIIVITLSFIIILLIILVYSIINKQKKKINREIMEINSKYTDTLTKYNRALNERKKLVLGIDKIKADKDNEIENLKSQLSTYIDYSNRESWDTEQYLIDQEIVTRIHDLATKGKVMNAKEWIDLQQLVQKLLPKFYEFITNSKFSLTDKEEIICILTRLHFIPTEICSLLNLRKQRVSNIRANLNKRMFNKIGSKSFTSNIYRI